MGIILINDWIILELLYDLKKKLRYLFNNKWILLLILNSRLRKRKRNINIYEKRLTKVINNLKLFLESVFLDLKPK